MRKAFFCLFLANLLFVLIVEIVGSLCIAVGYSVVYSKYRELDLANVVDHEKLKSEFSLDADADWGIVVEYLVDDFVVSLLRSRHFIAVLFAINSICAAVMWRSMRP